MQPFDYIQTAEEDAAIATVTRETQAKFIAGGTNLLDLMKGGVEAPRNLGGFVTANLADYLVPVNADIPDIDVAFINKPDPYINPMEARGLGELGIVGAAAVIANAVYHATGKRIRELPITPEKLMP